MNTIRLGGLSVSESSYKKATAIVESKPQTGKMTTEDVLDSLRQMMPGWNISTSSDNWGEGFRNIEISRDILKEMAEDPAAMKKYKALLLDLEDTVPALEEWARQNEGQSIEFGITIDAGGNVTSLAVVRTLLGSEARTFFDLSDDKLSWSETVIQKLDALTKGDTDKADGSISWLA